MLLFGMEVWNHYTSHQFLILSRRCTALTTVNVIEHSIMTINDEYKRIWKEVVTSHMNVPHSHSSGMNNMYAFKNFN